MTSILEISARGSLILWAKFQIPVGPRSGREGEKCRPLDHIRQIPFINQAPFASHIKINFYIFIQNSSTYFFHVVFTLCLGTLYICNLRMRSFRTSYFKVQGNFEVILYNNSTNCGDIQSDTVITTPNRCIQCGVGQSMCEFCECTKETDCSTPPSLKLPGGTFCSSF